MVFKIRFTIIFLCFLGGIVHLDAQEKTRPKVALVFSGGGAKGFAHIGALKVIEESGIPVDIIVGNSIGSIVGGLYSIGYTASEIESFANSTDWEQLFADEVPRKLMAQDLQVNQQRYVLSLPVDENNIPRLPFSLIKGQNVLNLLCELTSNVPANADFSKFPVNFACIGVDITNGEEVVIRNGFLPTAIYSSISIPGVFQLEEHNGRTMVDGGVVNNFPTDVAKSMGADIIIGVDIRNDLQTKAELQTMRDLVNQLINFYSIDKDSINKEYCDVLIRPDISGFSGSSYNTEAVDSLISRGFQAAAKALPEIEKLKQQFSLKPRDINQSMAEKQSYAIHKIELTGKYSLTDNFIRSQIDLELPGEYSTDDIKAVIDRLYGLGCFSKVYFKIREEEEGEILELILNESAIKDFNLGLRVNTTNAVGILLNYTQKDYKRWVGSYSLGAEVSSNPGFDIRAEITRENLPAIGINLKGKYKTYDYFEGRNKRASAQLYFGAANIYLFHHYGTYSRAGIGFTEEFFTGDIFSEEPDSIIISAGENAFISNLYAYYSRDNLDHYYYPTKGSEIYAEFALFEDERFDNINPSALFSMRSFIPMANRFTLLLNTHVRTLMSSGYPVLKSNFYGGHDYEIYFDNHLPFYGAPPIGVSRSYTAIGLAGIRTRFGRHYVSLMGNVMAHNNDIQVLEDTGFIWGTGLTYSFRSLGGPLEITMSYSGAVKRLGFSVNLGLWY